MLGAALLWFGWFGFNAGSALTAGGLASSAFVATNTRRRRRGLHLDASFMVSSPSFDARRRHRSGGRPGHGHSGRRLTLQPWAALLIGAVAAFISYHVMLFRAKKMGVDESLDVWACHGVGGAWGVIAVGIVRHDRRQSRRRQRPLGPAAPRCWAGN